MQCIPHSWSGLEAASAMNRRLLRYNPQFDFSAELPAAGSGRSRRCMRAVEFKPDSTDQAAALLHAVSKRGLAGHLGRLVRRAARVSGWDIDELAVAELVALLLLAAHHVLPVPADGHGAPGWVGRFFGVELERLSPEDIRGGATLFSTGFSTGRRSRPPGRAGRPGDSVSVARAASRRGRPLRYAPGWLSRLCGGPRPATRSSMTNAAAAHGLGRRGAIPQGVPRRYADPART